MISYKDYKVKTNDLLIKDNCAFEVGIGIVIDDGNGQDNEENNNDSCSYEDVIEKIKYLPFKVTVNEEQNIITKDYHTVSIKLVTTVINEKLIETKIVSQTCPDLIKITENKNNGKLEVYYL